MLLNRFFLTAFTCIALFTTACKKEKPNVDTGKPATTHRLKYITWENEYAINPSAKFKVYSAYSFEYDEHGYVWRITHTDTPVHYTPVYSSTKKVITYKRDAGNKVIEEEMVFTTNGKPGGAAKTNYIYGSLNELIQMDQYQGNSFVRSVLFSWTGNRLTTIRDGSSGSRYELTYNNSGDVTDIISWLTVNEGADTVKYIVKADISYDNFINPLRTVYGLPIPSALFGYEPPTFSQHNYIRYAMELGDGSLSYVDIVQEYNEDGLLKKSGNKTYSYEKVTQ